MALIAAWQGPAAAGFWGLALRYLKAPATLVGGAVSQALYPALAAGGAASEQGRAAVRRVMRTLALLALPLVLVLWLFAPGGLCRGLRRTLARGRRAGARAGAVHRHALRGVAAVGGDHGLGCAGLGAEAVAGGPGAVRGRAGRGAGTRWAECRGLGGVGGDGLYFGWFFWKLATWPVPTAAAP